MEVVQNFNRELKTLLDHRPPVSRQKMSLITKAAMRGLKFYKHVVQSVEKFIQKCNVDYKIPGLYVVDAIVRQSRHQYGGDRDVFAPRFLKNLLLTFQHLYQCDEKDRPLITRVLNLWLKNDVFPHDVTQSLLDLGERPTDSAFLQRAQQAIYAALTDYMRKKGADVSAVTVPMMSVTGSVETVEQYQPGETVDLDTNEAPREETTQVTVETSDPSSGASAGGGLISSIAALLQRFADGSGQDTSHYVERLQVLHTQVVEQSSRIAQGEMIDQEVLQELHAIMLDLQRVARDAYAKQQAAQSEAKQRAMAARAVLDYDYDDSDEEADAGNLGASDATAAVPEGQGIEPDLLEQLAQMTDTLAQTQALQEELRQARLQAAQAAAQAAREAEVEQQQQRQWSSPGAPRAVSPPHRPPPGGVQVFDYGHQIPPQEHRPPVQHLQPPTTDLEEGEVADESAEHNSSRHHSTDTDMRRRDRDYRNDRDMRARGHERDSDMRRHRDRSRSPIRDPRVPQPAPPDDTERGSRSGSRGRRKRSRSRERDRKRRSKERKEKERDHLRERRKKGLPSLRERRVSIVSCTVWVGKIHKNSTEKKLRDLLEEYGAVDELFMIPPRGCAYVVYNQRKSAALAVKELQRAQLDGSVLKVAWAPNSGIKDSTVKEFWDVDEGATYVPFDRFPKQGWKDLLQGGAQIDQESLSVELAAMIKEEEDKEDDADKKEGDKPVPPPIPPPGLMAMTGMPGMPPIPGMMPGMMPGMPFLPPAPMMAMAAAMQTAVRMATGNTAPGNNLPALPDMSVPPPNFPVLRPPVDCGKPVEEQTTRKEDTEEEEVVEEEPEEEDMEREVNMNGDGPGGLCGPGGPGGLVGPGGPGGPGPRPLMDEGFGRGGGGFNFRGFRGGPRMMGPQRGGFQQQMFSSNPRFGRGAGGPGPGGRPFGGPNRFGGPRMFRGGGGGFMRGGGRPPRGRGM